MRHLPSTSMQIDAGGAWPRWRIKTPEDWPCARQLEAASLAAFAPTAPPEHPSTARPPRPGDPAGPWNRRHRRDRRAIDHTNKIVCREHGKEKPM